MTIPLTPASTDTFSITKSVNKPETSAGDFVIYTLTGRNMSGSARTINVVDTLPFGFSYVPGSATYDGVADEPVVNGRVLTWGSKAIAATKGFNLKVRTLPLPFLWIDEVSSCHP